MILSYTNFEFKINFEKDKIVKLNIENKKVLKEIILNFINNLDQVEGNIILYKFKSFTRLNPSNYIYVISDYFNLDISKNYLNKYYKILNEKISYDYLEKFNILRNNLLNYIKEITFDENFDLEISEITNIEIFKLLNLKLKDQENYIYKIMEIMKFINEILNIEIFVLINPEIYFSKEELYELYKFTQYNDFRLLIISCENNLTKNNYIDKIIMIDEDFCEIF